MDTVEELNGTYFYKGICNISAGELFFWILLDEISQQMGGIGDLSAMALIILGQPDLSTRQKMQTATVGTSVASVFARRYLDIELPFRLPTITNKSITYLKPMMVNNLGKFVGRAVPVVGWVLLANDLASISFRATCRYNRIARGKDKIW
ncbi:STM2901 family protein [Erwinia sp. CGal63]|uniref:STM2901 family protein n=1 Tax=Erwinia sp. CGal63 TaxID=2919889 RepID=UPI00300930B5